MNSYVLTVCIETHGNHILTVDNDVVTVGNDILTVDNDILTVDNDKVTVDNDIVTVGNDSLDHCLKRLIHVTTQEGLIIRIHNTW